MDSQFIRVYGHVINRDEIEFASFIKDGEIVIRFSSGYVLKLQPETISDGEKAMRALMTGDKGE